MRIDGREYDFMISIDSPYGLDRRSYFQSEEKRCLEGEIKIPGNTVFQLTVKYRL